MTCTVTSAAPTFVVVGVDVSFPFFAMPKPTLSDAQILKLLFENNESSDEESDLLFEETAPLSSEIFLSDNVPSNTDFPYNADVSSFTDIHLCSNVPF